jgi:hypothetical protein
MKIFVAHLRDGTDQEFEADAYHRDGEQYVFVSAEGAKLDFVLVAEVVSISEHPKNLGRAGGGF